METEIRETGERGANNSVWGEIESLQQGNLLF